GDWNLIRRKDGAISETLKARDLWNDIGESAWASADPGLQFDTTINDWHTCKTSGRINASNPCSEYMFLDDTACNLASMNLLTFLKDDYNFDVPAFEHSVRMWTITLEIAVMMAQFPSQQIADLSYKFRTLGLGFANIGGYLMASGIPYDSVKARSICAAVSSVMTGVAYETSAEMAESLGAFSKFPENREDMLQVIRNHRRAANGNEAGYESLQIMPVPFVASECEDPELASAAASAWDRALEKGEAHGYRNAQVSVVAPTGTIGLVMDCDTTGIEPDFALVKFKKLAGGGYFKIINRMVPSALKKLGYNKEQVKEVIGYAVGHGTLEGSSGINLDKLRAKGFTEIEIDAVEASLVEAFDIRFVFKKWTLGEEFCTRVLCIDASKIEDISHNILESIDFTKKEIE
ncbi:MAG: vitamin B12-dependent ribonucleotide reductase, partial [Rhodospirillales bacterium]